jgi:hypothetical protein
MTELETRLRIMQNKIEAGQEVHLPSVASLLREAQQTLHFYKTVWVHTDTEKRKRAWEEYHRCHCPNCGEEIGAESNECTKCGWWGLGVNN